MCSLYIYTSQCLKENCTVRCIIFSLRTDVGKQTITFVATNNNTRADPGFFKRGGCKYESSRQTSRGQRNGGGGSWRVMFEYADFRHFDFRGMNLSDLRHYYYGLRVQYNNDSCLSNRLDWKSLYKGLLAYLVFLQSLGVIYGDLPRDQRIALQALLT